MPNYRRLRILEVSEPNKNGVFIHVRGLLQHLVRRGHGLAYAYSSRRSASQLEPLLSEIGSAGAQTKDMEISNAPSVGDAWAGLWLLWHVHMQRPDVVHGHSSKAGALVRLVAALWPGPGYVYTPHAYYSMSARPKGLRIGYWWVEQILARLAVTINISRDERLFAIRALGLTRVQAIIAANPVDLQRFRPVSIELKQRLRAEWGIPAGAVVFGTVARFDEQKDMGTFYRAAIQCAQQMPSVHFVHLGTGADAAFYRGEVTAAGVRAQFTFIDYLADTEPFYACLDGFVITSRFEAGWPIVMLEALALGLPLVTTDFVGLQANNPKDLTHAVVVRVGDAKPIADALIDMAITLTSGQRFATDHRAYVETHFSPEVCYGKVEYLYRKLADTGSVV